MMKLHNLLRNLILWGIDLFYPLFKKIMPLQTFRYAACGGFNTVLNITVIMLAHKYLFKEAPVSFHYLFPKLIISAHIAAFLVGFSVTFPFGFYLSRYVVFQEIEAKKSTQLIKYFTVVIFCLVLNYGFLKLFVEVFIWDLLPSVILTTGFVIGFSYFSQKNFTFKSMD